MSLSMPSSGGPFGPDVFTALDLIRANSDEGPSKPPSEASKLPEKPLSDSEAMIGASAPYLDNITEDDAEHEVEADLQTDVASLGGKPPAAIGRISAEDSATIPTRILQTMDVLADTPGKPQGSRSAPLAGMAQRSTSLLTTKMPRSAPIRARMPTLLTSKKSSPSTGLNTGMHAGPAPTCRPSAMFAVDTLTKTTLPTLKMKTVSWTL